MNEHDEQQDQQDVDIRLRLSEAVESLDGFERIAIGEHWNKDLEELGATKLVIGVIAMLHRRTGLNVRDAFRAAMALPLKDVNDYFAPEPQEPVVDLDGESEADDTPAGKELPDSENGTGPTPDSPWLRDSPSPQMSISG